MKGPLIATAVAVVIVVLLTFLDPGLGSPGLWPVLIAFAVGIVAVPSLGRLAAFLIGIGVGWVTFALRAGFLPDLPAGRAIAIASAVLVVGIIGVVTSDRVPVWAGLAGIAVYGAAYAPNFSADPTLFLTSSVVALGQVALGVGIGFAAGYIVDWIAGPSTEVPTGEAAHRGRIIELPKTPEEAVR